MCNMCYYDMRSRGLVQEASIMTTRERDKNREYSVGLTKGNSKMKRVTAVKWEGKLLSGGNVGLI